jgi:hypothetical protein
MSDAVPVPTSREQASSQGVPCQLEAFPARLDSGPPSREEPWSWYVRRRLHGFLLRARRELGRLRGARTPAATPALPAPAAWPAPELEAGDRVRVRPAEYIRATLDEKGCLKGCGFGLGQYQYCGREFTVVRRVDNFFDEGRARMLKGRNLVLLDTVHCDGSSSRFTHGCDRMCFYFWRTEWLEKVEDEA